MTLADPASIASWHAHIYFDDQTRDTAWALRETIAAEIGDAVEIGRFHERPVGPHPMWSYQLAVTNERFAAVFAWLVVNHGELDVFVHPNTGDALRDHRDAAVWIGHSHVLNLAALGG
ncbi:DOPA 4,5-dioxygenase family protein [Paraburkholderia bannensis]|uniref:DOPA 4,5-dioxygenase family protein n=1 Tax=Paraburkholderia bannensis TaxID=765414 RepID=UPI002AB7128A|nr:DOPA 4,5-dioxygenase family protein [Paraburkholderia bannensis]